MSCQNVEPELEKDLMSQAWFNRADAEILI